MTINGTTSFSVLDPYFNTTSYSYGEIGDVIAYRRLKAPREINTPMSFPLFKQCDPVRVHVLAALCQLAVMFRSVLAAASSAFVLGCSQRPGHFRPNAQAWGKNVIEHKTVCAVGCLMSSISMALNGHGISIAGQPSNPGTLNAWLKANNGYTQDDDLEVPARCMCARSPTTLTPRPSLK